MKRRGREFKVRTSTMILIVAVAIIAVFIVFNTVQNFVAEEKIPEGLEGELATLIGGPNLIAYYEFEGNADDSSGNGHHGILKDAKIINNAEKGNVLSLDGSNDYVDISGIKNDVDTTTGAISLWVKLDNSILSDRKAHGIVEIGDIPANQNRIHIRKQVSNAIDMRYRVNRKNTQAVITDISDFNNWHHIVGIWNSTHVDIYDNAVLMDSADRSGNGDIDGSKFVKAYIGRDAQRGYTYFKGLIDDVMIFSKSLNETEILGIYYGEERVVKRRIEAPDVTLRIFTAPLDEDEIVMITEQVPSGITIAPDSWSSEPTYNLGDTLVWLFANNPPQWLGPVYVTEEIPETITYQISGASDDKFKGKWGLHIENLDALIIGEHSL